MNWLAELEALAVRFAHLGTVHDLASLTLAEAWALLCRLRSLKHIEEAQSWTR